MTKLGAKTHFTEKYLREQISKRANKLGVSSEAVLAVWAKRLGIGTLQYQRRLPTEIQTEIRNILPIGFNAPKFERPKKQTGVDKKYPRSKSPLSLAIEYLIQDIELRDRCGDLIKAQKNHDRAYREATTVLEDRIRNLSGLGKMKPSDLVGKAINPDPNKAILRVSQDSFEQEGIFSICKGLMLGFRDTTHHELTDKFSKEDALKFCGFVDSLLAILNDSEKQEVI